MRELAASTTEPAADAPAWLLYDYISPGLRVVRPDDAFPHMRPGDPLHHPWKYLRRDVPHLWYADERFPLMGFLNRDEAVLLHNLALQFAGRRALEIGSWLGWSTCHLALAGVHVDVIDPAHDDPVIRVSVEESVARCGVSERVNLIGGRSPESIAKLGGKWSLFFVDGDHEAPAPLRDTIACLPYAADDCAFVFHDLAAPAVAAALHFLAEQGFHVIVYQTAQIMAFAWRGNVAPVAHVADPNVAWQLPAHVAGLPFAAPARSAYPQLRDRSYSGAASRPSVCIVTSELIGPFKNGGVGTAMTGLAETLAGDGLAVTVLYTGTVWAPEIDLQPWKQHYAARGIELASVSIEGLSAYAGPLLDCGYGIASLVYDWLAPRRFDVIHFNDCCGEGSLCLAAKKLGLAFTDSLLVVALHSPSRWVFELNHVLPSNRLAAAFDYAERVSIACADVLWSPSTYLLDWIAAHRFETPEQTYVQQYVLPNRLSAESSPGQPERLSYVVFFGRLEERKGLRLFCNAVHLLRDQLADRGITVTFLGKPERCAGMPALDYIAKRAESWTFPVQTVTDLGQPEALQYLRGGEKLAVMASPIDNSPCTVYEALSAGIPFLAARTGGIPELIAEDDRDRVLFDHSTEGLANALREAIARGGWIAKPAVPQDETRASWTSMHAHWRTFLRSDDDAARELPTVAAIIDHAPGARLHHTIDSLVKCARVNRFLVLNRGGESLPVDNIDLVTADAAAIESELATIAADTILFIHSGVSILPAAFETMLQSMNRAPVDGLVPAGRVIGRRRTRVIPPLGGSAAFSFLEGVTFTGAMLVRREALLRAKSGRALATDSPFLGLTDFCVTRNERIWPYPEVVVERPSDCAVDVKSALPARVAAYGEVSSDDRFYMLAAGYGADASQRRRVNARQLALTAADYGFSYAVRAGSWLFRKLRMQ
jgi:glycosyltransferase involved in cell wall biosynthesis/SAM-dependent methyltransferase